MRKGYSRLKKVLPSPGRLPRLPKPSRRLGRVLIAAFVIAVLIGLQYVPTSYLAVSPGPVMELGPLVEVEGYPAKGDSFYMVSVVAREASIYSVIRAVLDPSVALWSKKAVLGSRSPEEYIQENRELMVRSQNMAIYAALRNQGIPASPEGPFPVKVSIKTGEIAGPSAGLAFCLELIGRMDGDLARGRKIAATGVLDKTGRVLPVGGVAQKALACQKEGIEVLLVPAANLDEARRYAKGISVIGVDSVDEAVQAVRAWSRSSGP